MSEFANRTPVKPPVGRAAAYEFAEWNPDLHLTADGKPVPAWEAVHIVRIPLPKPLAYLEGQKVTRVAVHRKAAGELQRALGAIHQTGLWDFLSPFAGGYTFRLTRGSTKLSMHALGLAVDFDPDRNPYHGAPAESRFGGTPEGRAVVRLFELYGWFWGGRFVNNPDAQHFQFARGV